MRGTPAAASPYRPHPGPGNRERAPETRRKQR